MTGLLRTLGSDAIKSCCAALYDNDWVSLLLGDSFHPGGLALTERLGARLNLGPESRLLDVASGRGASAIFLAQRFGCEVVGVDFGDKSVAQAILAAEEAGLSGQVQFKQADAEALPFQDGEFDGVICECSFCTFPDKTQAAAEFARVLRPGGRLGLNDITRSGPLPDELESLLAWIACLADAQSIQRYAAFLENAGVQIDLIEPHPEAISQMVQEIRAKLLGVELLVKLNKLNLPEVDFESAKKLARSANACIDQGTVGYVLLIGTKQS